MNSAPYDSVIRGFDVGWAGRESREVKGVFVVVPDQRCAVGYGDGVPESFDGGFVVVRDSGDGVDEGAAAFVDQWSDAVEDVLAGAGLALESEGFDLVAGAGLDPAYQGIPG